MDHASKTRLFKPQPTRTESTRETTSRVAREIIDSELVAMRTKTERLRAARLAREQTQQMAVRLANRLAGSAK
ncbi:hypothetical protein V6B08_03435 [Ferrovibrio sp. MS7]|jgi:hypothetical protein|uniref:hypothetical protein n=1 Tax=Ferrovibrio plantarum TaxID=3119164 RepID=UPI0031372C60